MCQKVITLNLALFLFCLSASSAFAATHVGGYTRSNGTYVAPYWRSSPNLSTADNWSTKGNVNPYTGVAGTKNPYSVGTGWDFWGRKRKNSMVPVGYSGYPVYSPISSTPMNPNAARQFSIIRFNDGRVCENCSVVIDHGYIAKVIHPYEGEWKLVPGEELSFPGIFYEHPTKVDPTPKPPYPPRYLHPPHRQAFAEEYPLVGLM